MSSFTDKIVDSFKDAIDLYKKSLNDKFSLKKFTSELWVLFVVENSERNVVD